MLNLVLSLSLSHTGHWKFNMAPHGKELSEDLKKRIVALHKDGIGQGCQTQGPRAYSGPPHHFMWPARAYDYRIKKLNKKKILLLYIVHYESAYQYHKFLSLFGVLLIRRN